MCRTSFAIAVLLQSQEKLLTLASHDSLLGLSLGLLLDVVLGTALLGLAGVVLLLVLGLGGRVAGDTSDGAAHGSGDTVCDAGAKVGQLALGLLLLALEVLLATRGLQGLCCE